MVPVPTWPLCPLARAMSHLSLIGVGGYSSTHQEMTSLARQTVRTGSRGIKSGGSGFCFRKRLLNSRWDTRQGGHQSTGVRVAGSCEDLFFRSTVDDPTFMKNRNAF